MIKTISEWQETAVAIRMWRLHFHDLPLLHDGDSEVRERLVYCGSFYLGGS